MSVSRITFRPASSPHVQQLRAPCAAPVLPARRVPKHAERARVSQFATPLLPALRQPGVCRAQERPQGPGAPDSFSHTLFMETIDYHKRINVHPAIETLRGHQVPSARIYWRMLVDKLAFHEALESLLARYTHERLLAPFFAPELTRSRRLRHDLHTLGNKPHAHVPRPAPASQAAHDYIEALSLAARRDPRALAAHAWLHYLGDMHGGQLMRGRLAERHGDDTVSCFEFAKPVEELRKIYGRALDVPLSNYEKQLLREQAMQVYEHSLRMHDAWLNP